MHDWRDKLVKLALAWEQAFGNAPHITAAVSELDAARLVGCSIDDYAKCMRGMTTVRRGYDFEFNGQRYQVKANRPSAKPGSFVTLVPKAKNYDWDFLVWILYYTDYQIAEAWLWEAAPYRQAFEFEKRLSPAHYQRGTRLKWCSKSADYTWRSGGQTKNGPFPTVLNSPPTDLPFEVK